MNPTKPAMASGTRASRVIRVFGGRGSAVEKRALVNTKQPRPLVISPDEFPMERLLAWWEYLAPTPGKPIGLSPFGDWFLEVADGSVWRLDLLEGSFERLVADTSEFWARLGDERGQDEWLQAGHVLALEQRGLVRDRGQCYVYKVHPRLGATIGLSNMELGDAAAWQMFCAQLHQQLDGLPSGAAITRLECDEEGRITVCWR
jgi:hypothetical protein